MSYASIQFVIFALVISIIYYIMPGRFRWSVILCGSVIFYTILCSWLIVFPFLGSFFSWLLIRFLPKEHNTRSKLMLAAAVICNLSALLACKWGYWAYGLFSSNDIRILIVPVGISFYTLSIISYCIDVYNNKTAKENNYARFLLFTLFFPYIVQGPIVSYSAIKGDLFANHEFDYVEYAHGWQLILWGFIEKLVIADWLGIVVDTVFESQGELTGAFVAFGFVMYSFQLYLDFSGCVDIAIGTAQLFGIKLPQNFRQPYFAQSVQEFWQRWHISLSTWLRNYIYIPLGGNRKGSISKCINTMVVFLASGIWHGVGLRYILWGVLHGVLVNIDSVVWGKKNEKNGIISRVARIVITFLAVTFLWGIFRANSISQFISLLKNMFRGDNVLLLLNSGTFERLGIRMITWLSVMVFLLLKLVVDILHEKKIHIRSAVDEKPMPVRWILYTFAILVLLVFGRYGGEYTASAFIYGQF